MSLITSVGRGGLAGACAGLVSGLVSLLLAGPVLERAIALEAVAGEEHELFSRDVQQVGLVVAAVLTGVALGLIFGVVYWYLHRHDPASDVWGRSIRLAGAGFLAVGLLPFLRFPATPPGVGDPGTVDTRTAVWLAAIVISVAAVALAWNIASAAPTRQLAAAGVIVAGLALLFALPGSVSVGDFPADLLWTFRLLSLLTIALVWAGIGVGFGLAGARQAAPSQGPSSQDVPSQGAPSQGASSEAARNA